MATKAEPTTAVAVRENDNPLAFLDKAKPLPATISELVDMRSWAACILTGEKYKEPNADYLSKKLLLSALNSESLFSTDDDSSVIKLQQWVTDAPDSTTGPIEVHSIYVAPSRLSEQPWTFILADFISLANGVSGTFSTGSTQVQGFFLKALALGQWPVQCQIKRITRTDRGGRHLFNVFPAFD
jgi:hypothetical protein